MILKRRIIVFSSIILIFLFQTSIIFYPGWLVDDTAFFLLRLKNNLFGNATYGFSLENQTDRFIPFLFFGYQFISFITFKPFFFFFYNLFLSLTTLIILQIIRIKFELKYWHVFIFLVFVPGYSDSFFQIVNPEKELIFFWSLFLLTIITLLGIRSQGKYGTILIFLSLPLIFFSLFLKETTFILLSTFSSSLLFFNSKTFSFHTKKIKIHTSAKYILYSGLLMSFVFLVLFYIFTEKSPVKEGYHYFLTPADSILTRIIFSVKALILYAISDPLLVLLLPGLFFYSLYQRLLIPEGNPNCKIFSYISFFDACAVSSLTFVAAYIILGFHGVRYLLPAYPFGLIAISAYLQIHMQKMIKDLKLWKYFTIIIFVLLLINSVSSSINLAIFYKVSSYNFMQYKDELINKINTFNFNNDNSVIYYIPGKSKNWMIYSAKQHENIMNFYGVNLNNKNFKYNDSNQNWQEQKKANESKIKLKKGDIMLILPNSDISQKQILTNLKGINLKKIFSTNSPNYFEIPEIRHFLKFIMLKNKPNLLGTKMIFREVDYTIFEVL